MAIACTFSPTTGAATGDVLVTGSLTGLATSTTYSIYINTPTGVQNKTVVTSGGTTGTFTFVTSSPGTYTVDTQVARTAAVTGAGTLTVRAIN